MWPRHPTSDHEHYGTRGDSLLPEVAHVGWRRISRASDAGLFAHAHPGRWEICYLLQGQVDWWVENEVHDVPPGHVYLTRPDELHGAVHSLLQPCELLWVQVEFGHALPGLDAAATANLEQGLSALRRRLFPAPQEFAAPYWRILLEHRRRQPWSALASRAALHQLMVDTIRAGNAQPGHAGRVRRSAAIRNAQEFARARLDREIAVTEMAAAAGLSISRFHTRFTNETGLAPADWLRRERLREARELLLDPRLTILDIALRLGFSSSQYFATTFRRYTGITPSDYRSAMGRSTSARQDN